MKYVDLSYDVDCNIKPFPGDEELKLQKTKDINKNGYTEFTLSTQMHIGTHIDSPMHMIETDKYLSEYPIERFVGNSVLIDVRDEKVITLKDEYYSKIKENYIILLYTGWSEKYGSKEYFVDYPVLSNELADFLVRKKVKMVGLDTPSPDKYDYAIHKLFFENNICILENLRNLSKLLYVDEFEVFAQPLKIKAEASLVRAFAQYKGY